MVYGLRINPAIAINQKECNTMKIKIHDLNWFSSDKKINEFLVSNAGKWVEVETNHLFDNQYNTKSGFRVYDYHVSQVLSDERELCIFNEWQGKKPCICLFLHLNYKQLPKWEDHYSIYDTIIKDFNLSYNLNGNHYVFTNHCKTLFKFVYRDGVFYESNGIGYKKLKSLKGKVRNDAIKPLTDFFKVNYHEAIYAKDYENTMTEVFKQGFKPELHFENGYTYPTRFVKGNSQVWDIYRGWQTAQLINGKFTNHCVIDNLVDALKRDYTLAPKQTITPFNCCK